MRKPITAIITLSSVIVAVAMGCSPLPEEAGTDYFMFDPPPPFEKEDWCAPSQGQAAYRVDQETASPLAEGELRLLHEVWTSLPARMRKGVAEITIVDTPLGLDGKAVGEYRGRSIVLRRSGLPDLTEGKEVYNPGSIVQVLTHEACHNAHYLMGDTAEEFFALPNAEGVKNDHEDFAIYCQLYLTRWDAMALEAYYDGPDFPNGRPPAFSANQELEQEKHAFMRQKVFCGDEPQTVDTIGTASDLWWYISPSGKGSNGRREFSEEHFSDESAGRIEGAMTPYLEDRPDPRLTPLFGYLQAVGRLSALGLPWPEAARDEEKFGRAVKIVNEALARIGPDSAWELPLLLGKALWHRYRHEPTEAEAIYLELIQKAQKAHRFFFRVKVQFELAMMYECTDHRAQGVAVLQKIRNRYPGTTWARQADELEKTPTCWECAWTR